MNQIRLENYGKQWSFANETLFELMSCGVEGKWYTVIKSFLNHNSFHQNFAVRKKRGKLYSNLMEYALKFKHFKTFNLLFNQFYNFVLQQEDVCFAIPCNEQFDTVFHLLIRYNCFQERGFKINMIAPYFDSLITFPNKKGETVLFLACLYKDKYAISLILECRNFLFSYIYNYFCSRNDFEMKEFLISTYAFLYREIYYI